MFKIDRNNINNDLYINIIEYYSTFNKLRKMIKNDNSNNILTLHLE